MVQRPKCSTISLCISTIFGIIFMLNIAIFFIVTMIGQNKWFTDRYQVDAHIENTGHCIFYGPGRIGVFTANVSLNANRRFSLFFGSISGEPDIGNETADCVLSDVINSLTKANISSIYFESVGADSNNIFYVQIYAESPGMLSVMGNVDIIYEPLAVMSEKIGFIVPFLTPALICSIAILVYIFIKICDVDNPIRQATERWRGKLRGLTRETTKEDVEIGGNT